MNPLTNMKNILKLSELDLKSKSKSSWHDMYKDSAWIFVGGLPYTLTEGDVICVFSQYGEIVNINLARDKSSGKSKGFCFLCYEDQRSTILAVDNLNGIKILGRTLRVDHVADYKPPKENDKMDEETLRLYMEGCAPKTQSDQKGDTEEKMVMPSEIYSHKHKKAKSPKQFKDAKREKRKERKSKDHKKRSSNESNIY